MMKVKERLTQKIYPDKWDELEAVDKEFDAVESTLGFPPKRRYRLIVSSQSINILVVEREWDSIADMEAAWEKLLVHPVLNALNAQLNQVVEDSYTEILMPLP